MLALLGALLALPLLAPLSGVLPVVMPSPQVRAEVPEGDSSKEDGQDRRTLVKVTPVGKVKECCGYPIGPPRGFKLSFYWLAWESEYANAPYDTDIYTQQGFSIGKFPRTFVFELKLEGSGILRDGRVINYDGECNYGVGTCFRQVDPKEHPLGMGGQGRPLQVFRSVAIDPRYIPIGTPLYIPQLVGIHMPDGTVHDGCVRADDTGGGIKQRKVDFFVESYGNYKVIADNLWWDTGITPLVEEPRCAYLRRGDPSRDRENEHLDWAEIHRHTSRSLALAGRVPAKKRALVRGRLSLHGSKVGAKLGKKPNKPPRTG